MRAELRWLLDQLSEYFLGLRLRAIVIPFKSVVVFGGSEKRREPLVILPEPLVILSEPLDRFLARLRGKLRPKGAEPAIVGQPPLEPAIVVQPPLELSDVVPRFE